MLLGFGLDSFHGKKPNWNKYLITTTAWKRNNNLLDVLNTTYPRSYYTF